MVLHHGPNNLQETLHQRRNKNKHTNLKVSCGCYRCYFLPTPCTLHFGRNPWSTYLAHWDISGVVQWSQHTADSNGQPYLVKCTMFTRQCNWFKNQQSTIPAKVFFIVVVILQLYCPIGISTVGNLGCFPQRKPAVTVELSKPTAHNFFNFFLAFSKSIKLWHGLQYL